MTLAELSSRDAVLRAIALYDEVGQEDFLKRFGFKRARRYFLDHGGKRYDSKAIIGVAHSFQFGSPLKSSEFNGGERTVARKLKELGFDVDVLPPSR